jgi:hypothetical protein
MWGDAMLKREDDRVLDIPTFSPSYLHSLLGAPHITAKFQHPNTPIPQYFIKMRIADYRSINKD